jgi:FtsZ-interacting cell division protein YlmF
MSEYQYYEFQAIDRPLIEREMTELRAHSTRARITPTSFVNDYSWGSFKGDEDTWMERYFDAFLYLANWGTHVLKLRLPAYLLDAKTARMYCVGEQVSVREKKGNVIVSFVSEDEEGDDWVEGAGRLSSLTSVRSELARGDLRVLYLGWLLCLQNGDFDDDELEPPVPAGLGELSASLEGLVEFLRISPDLVAVAATASTLVVSEEPKAAEVHAWVAKFSNAEKDELLARMITGDTALASELLQRVRRERSSDEKTGKATPRRRTAAELLREAENAGKARRRLKAEKTAKEKARREHEVAVARAQHLDKLAGRESTLWKQVEKLIATKQPKRYDEALALLEDLRDLAARNDGGDFRRRLEALRGEHARKATLIKRLHKLGL